MSSLPARLIPSIAHIERLSIKRTIRAQGDAVALDHVGVELFALAPPAAPEAVVFFVVCVLRLRVAGAEVSDYGLVGDFIFIYFDKVIGVEKGLRGDIHVVWAREEFGADARSWGVNGTTGAFVRVITSYWGRWRGGVCFLVSV